MDEQQDTSLRLHDVIGALRRRLALIAAAIVGLALAALAVSLLQTPQYTADASLLFRDPGFDQRLFSATAIAPESSPEREAATNLRLVSLDAVAARTANRLGGDLDAEQVADKVSLEEDGASDLVTVAATDSEPARAARLANAYARSFIDFRRRADRRKIENAIRLVEDELVRLDSAEAGGGDRLVLETQVRRLATLRALQTGNAELVQRAVRPEDTSSPQTARNVALGAVFGLLVGIAAALVLARVDRTVRDTDELEAIFDLPLLGVVPESDTLARAPIGDGSQLDFAELEAFRMVRAQLRYFNVDRQIRSIVVTSAAPREGKSTVAWHLARAAAASGVSTLLIEADLHRQTFAGSAGLAPLPGLTEVLTRQSELADAVQSVEVESTTADDEERRRLSVLVAGATPPNAAELVESEAMARLLETEASEYELVIVDTPPAGVVADAIPIMQRARGVIVVGRLSGLTRDAGERMAKQLQRLEVDPLGLVATFAAGQDGYYSSYGGADRSRLSSRPRVGSAVD